MIKSNFHRLLKRQIKDHLGTLKEVTKEDFATVRTGRTAPAAGADARGGVALLAVAPVGLAPAAPGHSVEAARPVALRTRAARAHRGALAWGMNRCA